MPSVRFTPGPFAYNERVAPVVVASIGVLALSGGKLLFSILTVGLMVAYMLDALRQKEAALAAIWVTLGVFNLTSLFFRINDQFSRSPLLMALMVGATSGTLLVGGMWATLQFHWMQVHSPGVVLALESSLLGLIVPVGATMLTWGSTYVVSASVAPYACAGLLCALYAMFGRPLVSSFHRDQGRATYGGHVESVAYATTRLHGASAAILAAIAPAMMYAATHWRVVAHGEHVWSLLMLASGPALMLAMLPDGLWWLSTAARQAARAPLGVLSLCVFLAGFEGRVVFPSFGAYLPVGPPWSVAFVSLALYTAAGLTAAGMSGALTAWADTALVGALLVVGAAAGGVALGLPLPILLAALVGAASLALFLETVQLRYHIVSAAAGMLVGGYFVIHHHWFLEIDMDGVSLHMVCALIVAAMAPALLIPGLAFVGPDAASPLRRQLLGGLLVAQTAVVAFVEEHMHAGRFTATESLYPPYLVLTTSGLGIAMVIRLYQSGQIPKVAAWASFCGHAGKLTMLLLSGARLVAPATAVVLAVTPPLVFYAPDPLRRRARLSPFVGSAHAASVVLAVGYGRLALFDAIELLLGAPPPEGALLGGLLLLAGAGLAPLVARCYPHSAAARRGLGLLIALGALLVVLRPPLPIKGGSRCPDLPYHLCPRLWDERHVPAHEADDVAIYGEGITRREHWPLWILVSAAMTGITSATATAHSAQSNKGRTGAAALGGLLLGLYIAREHFPGQLLLQGCVVGASLAAGLFVALIQPGASARPRGGVTALCAWGALFAASLVIQANVPLPPLPQGSRRLYPDAQGAAEVGTERHVAARVALLLTFTSMAVLMAFALKLRVGAVLRQKTTKGKGAAAYAEKRGPPRMLALLRDVVPARALAAVGNAMRLTPAANLRSAQLAADGLLWAPVACNALTLAAFVAGLALNGAYELGGDEGIFALAPLLLLLCQDNFLLRGIGDAQRYFPPLLAVSSYLACASAFAVSTAALATPASLLDTRQSGALFFVQNASLAALALPCHYLAARYALTRKKASDWTLLGLAPLSLLPLLFTQLRVVRLLAGSALVVGAAHYVSQRRVKRRGLKMI